MTMRLPPSAETMDFPPLFRRFSMWVERTGVVQSPLLMTIFSSIASLALTWAILRVLGESNMGNAFWIALLVPLPLTLVFGAICLFLVVSLERAWDSVAAKPRISIAGQAARVTASLGAAVIGPDQSVSLDKLVQLADVALYQAKVAGRDRVSISDANHRSPGGLRIGPRTIAPLV